MKAKSGVKMIKIGDRKIGFDQPVFIIAEAGVNHDGSLNAAKKLIDTAKAAGADAVKFQTFRAAALATMTAPKAGYQKRTTAGGSQQEMLKKLELSGADFRKLSAYCRRRGIMFLSTPFDLESADLLNRLGLSAFKISSGDLTNLPFLRQIASYRKPLLLSTGMATLAEVRSAVECVRSAGSYQLALLHCTSNYPTRPVDVNLRAMATMSKEFNVPVGYSDHTEGIGIAVAAVALGAAIIEKHFTLDKTLPGPDHQASLEPKELAALISAVRQVEAALGNGKKEPRRSERAVAKVTRKSLVAARDIPGGTKLTRELLAIKRPGTGIKPKDLPKMIGRTARRNIRKDSLLNWKQVAT
ncbi:MAG: N-acetylneuraminate synthase [Candidatus Margulisiibacteriota bacterium]